MLDSEVTGKPQKQLGPCCWHVACLTDVPHHLVPAGAGIPSLVSGFRKAVGFEARRPGWWSWPYLELAV